MLHFRALCHIGLDIDFIIEDLIKILHRLIDHRKSSIIWLDENALPCNFFSEERGPHAANMVDAHRELIQSHSCLFSNIGEGITSAGGLVSRSGSENSSCKLSGPSKVLNIPIKSTTRLIAVLSMFKDNCQLEFSRQEREIIESLMPHLRHAFMTPAQKYSEGFVAIGDKGIVVADPKGTITHVTKAAQEIIDLANHQFFTIGCPKSCEDYFHNRVLEMCKAVNNKIPERRDRFSNVELECAFRYGKLAFTAYWAEQEEGLPDGLVTIVVERKKPKQLIKLEKIFDLPIAPKEKEICYLMSVGKPASEITDELHVTKNTLKDYTKKIYAKLGVKSKEELLALVD